MNSDIYLEILLQMSYADIMTMCNTTSDYNKVCESRNMWYKLMFRDYRFDLIDEWSILEMKELYKKLYHLVDKTIVKIMCKLMPKRKIHNNLQDIYEKLFHILGHFYNDAHDLDGEAFKIFTKKEVTKIFVLFGQYFENDQDNLNAKTYNILTKFYDKFTESIY